MKKVLKKYQINNILLQLIVFTFVCVMVFINNFISYEFSFIKIGIKSFTVLTVIIFEVIINLYFQKAKKNYIEDENEKHEFNEKFLWFELIFLLDVLIIVGLVSQATENQFNIAIPLIIGFTLFYLISIFVRPYFGIKSNK